MKTLKNIHFEKVLKSCQFIMGLIAAFLFINGCGNNNAGKADTTNLPYQFVPKHKFTKNMVVVAQYFVDLDNDGIDELFWITHPKGNVYSIIFDSKKYPITGQVNFYNPLQPYVFFDDFDGDMVKDAFVVEQLPNSRRITIVNRYEKILAQFTAATRKQIVNQAKWDNIVYYLMSTDVNKDQSKDLIFATITGYAKYPRAVYAYDMKNDSLIWELTVPASIKHSFRMENLEITTGKSYSDVDGDGVPDLLFATDPVNNGVSANGMDDSRNWIFLLNKKGGVLWKKPIGQSYGGAHIYPFTSADGTTDIFVSQRYQQKNKNAQIFVYNGSDGRLIRQKTLEGTLISSFVSDLDKNGKPEFLLFYENGYIEMLDENFFLQKKKQVETANYNFFYRRIYSTMESNI